MKIITKNVRKITLAVISLLLVSSFLLSCAGGTDTVSTTQSTSATLDPGSKPENNKGADTSMTDTAEEMVKTIFKQYQSLTGSGVNGVLNLKEYYKNSQSGFLWSNFCGVGMQYYVCKLHPEDEEQKVIFRQMINNFKYFRQVNPSSNSAPDSVKYHSGRGAKESRGSGDCFFDDNIWVARNYLRAYELLGDKWFLEEARRVNNWVISGWNDELGGIVWSELGLKDNANEQHLERGLSANACGIIVNAQLARLAETEEHKNFHTEWAHKFYDFCKKMQNLPDSYDYWNGIHTVIVNGERRDGSINKVHFSYNSGSMILANLELYELETDEAKKAEYLKDAKGTAGAAKATFFAIDDKNGGGWYCKGDPWFAAILAESYLELYKYEPNIAGKYLDLFIKNVNSAYKNRDAKSGLFPYQATEKNTFARNETYVIHQVGVAQQAVICALYQLQKAK